MFGFDLNLLSDFDVISFDVFDTLLLRPYLTQEDLWLDLARRELGEKDGAAFLKARVAADKKTYAEATKRGGEHTLDEAYRLMPKRYVSLREKEERLQRECLVANPEMLEVWKRAGELGKKRIIVSDMYLSEAWFSVTLKEKGLGDYDALYVSSARQARKSSGKLFEIVKKDFARQKILHVGDNKQSDVKMAELAGLSVRYWVAKVLLPITMAAASSLLAGSVVVNLCAPAFLRVVLTTVLAEIVFCLFVWLLVINENEKSVVVKMLLADLTAKGGQIITYEVFNHHSSL